MVSSIQLSGTMMLLIGHPFGVIFVSSSIFTCQHVFSYVHLPLASRFIVALSVAIPAASLCICRRLYYIASMKFSASIDKAERRRAIVVDLAIGLGIPILEMILGAFLSILYSKSRGFICLHRIHRTRTSF